METAAVVIASHRPEFAAAVQESLGPWPTVLFDGSGAPSCSWVWNQCILACPTETVVICNEKARPTRDHVERLLQLLDDGYGIVGLYRFGFFGFRKELIRRVGFFDERYLGGWYEDNDFLLRLDEADIASYFSDEVPYVQLPSAWSHDGARAHFEAKWHLADNRWIRLLPELDPGYVLGPAKPTVFLTSDQSVWINMPSRRERVERRGNNT
jgi:hypothetical protein